MQFLCFCISGKILHMRSVIMILMFFGCQQQTSFNMTNNGTPPEKIKDIPVPQGTKRISIESGRFGNWLRNVKLKKDKTVYLYNGSKKTNQSAQIAVLDIPIGKQDLQQCADAIIRLRAEYLLSVKADDKIAFHATGGTLLDYSSWKKGYRWKLIKNNLSKQLVADASISRNSFEEYLQLVFMYCGTRSLQKELQPVEITSIMPGDVLIQGGSPGHAVIVMDVIIENNERKFLLAQSYMPAQDIHVLKNPLTTFYPWYAIPKASSKIYTPEWVFTINDCRRFPLM